MAGKKGKSGRRPGEKLRWHSKPVALAGSYLEVLIEAYMAGVPIPTDKDQVFVLPTKNKMWTGISTGHRKPRRVPWQIQRLLANVAIEYAVQFGAKDSALRCTK